MVVVGNIVVGGSGKTPLLLALCEYIKQQGYQPGVVSRGYGGSFSGVRQVLATDTAMLVGDEPLMIRLRADVPVVVAADRVAAIQYLLANNQCDIVLSDDGLQHYRMRRDLEIAVIDASRKFGNGFCLPAGPLRERESRLNDVDLIVYSGTSELSTDTPAYVLRALGIRKLNADEILPLTALTAKKIHAIAGIGNPSRFFAQLKQQSMNTIEHVFPDHHVYSQADFTGWNNACILMTEKDAVKCSHLDLADAWVFLVKAELSNALERQLEAMLLPLLKAEIKQ